jgi:hypothetical protein
MAEANSPKMTLEARLVQHMKTVGLGALIDDEDAITELAKRAVQEALFQPTRTLDGGGWGRTVESDSPVVAAAREVAKAAMEKLVSGEIERMMADPKAKEAIRNAIAVSTLTAIQSTAENNLRAQVQLMQTDVLQVLRNAGFKI